MTLFGRSPEARERMLSETGRDSGAVELSKWANAGIRDVGTVPLQDGSQVRVFSGQQTDANGATATRYLFRDEQGHVKNVQEGHDTRADEIIRFAEAAADFTIPSDVD